jgi:hypothetical protein
MRPSLLAPIAAAVLLAAGSAQAGPSCIDRNGDMIRCGTPGAMPVGWDLPRAERMAHDDRVASQLDGRGLFGLICFVGGLFALFALLPDFEEAWDGQENDEDGGG